MNNSDKLQFRRRQFLSMGVRGFGLFAAGGLLGGKFATVAAQQGAAGGVSADAAFRSLSGIGELQPPDANGIMLPAGFKSRVVARSGQPPVAGGSYNWHPAPDGGACFAIPGNWDGIRAQSPFNDGENTGGDDGWIYVSNSEMGLNEGGVGALRFNAAGEVVQAYPILENTTVNCAGGATPWGTWLSCEEHALGQVYECDPMGKGQAKVRPTLGKFQHEAVAVDMPNHCLYLTEDVDDGALYRFRAPKPDPNMLYIVHVGLPYLGQGVLEVAVRENRAGRVYLNWVAVSDPSAATTPTRYQVPEYAPFNRGEGIAYHEGAVYFTTTGDNRVWRYDIESSELEIIYDHAIASAASAAPILSGVDNVVLTPAGDVLVCEDGGDMQIVVITPDQALIPLLEIPGHTNSEITGAAFDPTHQRLYFSSQRGITGRSQDGITYEISRA
ncbi:MAG: alkaline phosphatase PhoX [Pseudohongiellaceae bacterium]